MKKNKLSIPRTAAYLVLLFLTTVVMVCCSNDEEDPPLEGDKYSISDISGNWKATQALFNSSEVVNKGSIDVIAKDGTFLLSIQSNGKYTITITLPGEANQIYTGLLGFDEEWLAVSYDDDPGEFEYWFIDLNETNTVLTLRGQGTYDLDGDGVEDPVYIDLVLAKN